MFDGMGGNGLEQSLARRVIRRVAEPKVDVVGNDGGNQGDVRRRRGDDPILLVEGDGEGDRDQDRDEGHEDRRDRPTDHELQGPRVARRRPDAEGQRPDSRQSLAVLLFAQKHRPALARAMVGPLVINPERMCRIISESTHLNPNAVICPDFIKGSRPFKLSVQPKFGFCGQIASEVRAAK